VSSIRTEPHHDGSPLYVSVASPALGDHVQLRIRVPRASDPPSRIYLRSTPDHEPRFAPLIPIGSSEGWDWWQAEIQIIGLELGYRFLLCHADGHSTWLNQAGLHDLDTPDSQDFRLLAYPAPPDWSNSTVMYQIVPDRFARSTGASSRPLPDWAIGADWQDDVIFEGPNTVRQFYGGDLDGIRDHLDHLNRLGVTMIYLTPVFPARSNHRYDATTFAEVDPFLGGDAALVELVAESHRRGLRVIGDLTTNHSGDAHEWFTEALGAPDAVESSFYYWLDPFNERYVSWYDVPSLPKLNWNSHELRARFIEGSDSVVAKWLRPPFNLDGWRVDVANMSGRYLTDDLNAEVRQMIRRTMIDVNPNTMVICESTNDATSDLQGDAWHGAMTYVPFTKPLWAWLTDPGAAAWWFGQPAGTGESLTAEGFYRTHRTFVDAIPWRVRLGNLNALDTHDTPRFMTHAIEGSLVVAVGLSMTMPGIPMMFAGDEFGLVGANGEQSRTPIPWDSVDDIAPIIDLYSDLIRLRTSHAALSEGGMRWLFAANEVLAFIRETAEECILIVASRSSFSIELPAGSIAGEATTLYGEAELTMKHSTCILSAVGPGFSAWSLPGVNISAPSTPVTPGC
jgi:alpha-glucosidase